MNKIPRTIATISQYISPERMRLGIPLLNCPKESAPMTNSRNKLPIPFPNAPKKMLQSLRKTGERIAVNSVVVMLYTCPSCGKTFRLDYSTLYHQMEDLIMIYLVSESEVAETYDLFYGEHVMADFRTEKYLNRIVTSANQLIEKIKIFDAGKDDRIIELVKLLAADSILKNNPAIDFDELRFAVDDDGTNILVIINKGEITGAVDIENMYEFASSHCDDFKDLRDDEDIVINREWILNKLAEAEN